MPQLDNKTTSFAFRALTMASLILAGESIFLPAFHLGRYFKTPLLATLDISVFQLGQLGAIYGISATGCYFLGGPLADRWSPKKLLALSLIVTSCGSLYMATKPSFAGLCALFAFWGVTTIFVFWAPLIRATREWATDDGQGKAFGILDAGRGLASAVIALIFVAIFAGLVGGADKQMADKLAEVKQMEIDDASAEAYARAKRELASLTETVSQVVRKLMYGYAGVCVLAAICVWCFVPDTDQSPTPEQQEEPPQRDSLRNLGRVLRTRAIWLQAVVIIAAYSAFKMIDNYGIYSEDAYGLTPTQSATLISYISFIRVGAAFGAGWVADRLFGVRVTIQICFATLVVSYGVFLGVSPQFGLVWLMIANMAISCLGFFALRGIYFALLAESGTPRELTGTAVGVISFVGYTPEIFMGPLTGYLINEARNNGQVLVGYNQIWGILLVLSACGIVAAWALGRVSSPS